VEQAAARIKGGESMSDEEYKKQIASIITRKRAMLYGFGYTPADLEPKYECSLCNDTGFVDDKPCSCFTARLIELLYDQSNIRDVLDIENFETFSFDHYSDQPAEGQTESPLDSARKAYQAALNFTGQFPKGENLFLCGSVGVGKTFLSNCIAKAVLDNGYSVIYLSAIKLFDILRESTIGDADSRNLAGNIYKCDLLIIDDLGTEIVSAFTASKLFDLINERILAHTSTVISTNLSVRDLQNTYSARILSRILGNYTMVNLLGDDGRIFNARKQKTEL
ncbi:MAG: ATP-binding protein, partial [Parasporobacterium sp.]|nr:ATP-binding protein [Parasporobacterium sp.]